MKGCPLPGGSAGNRVLVLILANCNIRISVESMRKGKWDEEEKKKNTKVQMC